VPKQAPRTKPKLSAPCEAHLAADAKAGRGKSGGPASRKRGGKHLREAEGNAKLAKERRLRENAQKHGAAHQTMGFSALPDTLAPGTQSTQHGFLIASAECFFSERCRPNGLLQKQMPFTVETSGFLEARCSVHGKPRSSLAKLGDHTLHA